MKYYYKEIAENLGDNWVYNEILSNKDTYFSYLTKGYLSKIIIIKQKNMFNISMYIISQTLTKDYDFFKEINVSNKKSPTVVARDIKRRLFVDVDEKIKSNLDKRKTSKDEINLKKYFDEAMKRVLNYYLSYDNTYNFDSVSNGFNHRLEMKKSYNNEVSFSFNLDIEKAINFICLFKEFIKDNGVIKNE